jgi:hypothetical protein
LPRDLFACEDGFIKALVCTDFLAHGVNARRIRLAEDAEHTFEAYTSVPELVKNQKRQMIGQTIVHILIDGYLKGLPFRARQRMAETLVTKEATDPGWLKRLIREHLERRLFWRLYPDQLGLRFRRLKPLPLWQKLRFFPSAAASFGIALFASLTAYSALKAGCTNYWPKASRAPRKNITHQTASHAGFELAVKKNNQD